MTKELKFMIRKRQNAIIKYVKSSRPYKKWRNKVQQKIKTAKAVYYEHKIANLNQCNSSKWWKRFKSLTGQGIKQEWYQQFVGDNVDVKSLANKINDMFLSVTENFSPLQQENEKIQVPVELLVTEQEVQFSLKSTY
jgi:hypothetical protein